MVTTRDLRKGDTGRRLHGRRWEEVTGTAKVTAAAAAAVAVAAPPR